VWVAGSVTDPLVTVVEAAASGARAAVDIAADLKVEEVEMARGALQSIFSAKNEARNTELLLGHRRHGLDIKKL